MQYQSVPVQHVQYQTVPVQHVEYKTVAVPTTHYQTVPVTTQHYQTVPVTTGATYTTVPSGYQTYQTVPAGQYYTTTTVPAAATTAEKAKTADKNSKTFLETDEQVDGEVSVWMVLAAALFCLSLFAVLMHFCQKKVQGSALYPEQELRSHQVRP